MGVTALAAQREIRKVQNGGNADFRKKLSGVKPYCFVENNKVSTKVSDAVKSISKQFC